MKFIAGAGISVGFNSPLSGFHAIEPGKTLAAECKRAMTAGLLSLVGGGTKILKLFEAALRCFLESILTNTSIKLFGNFVDASSVS